MQERRTKPDGYRWGCPGRGGTKKFGDSTRGGGDVVHQRRPQKGLKTADKRTGLIDVLAVGVCVECQGSTVDGFDCPTVAGPAYRLIPHPVRNCTRKDGEVWIEFSERDFPDLPCIVVETDDRRRRVAIVEVEQIGAAIDDDKRAAVVCQGVKIAVTTKSPKRFGASPDRSGYNDPRGTDFGPCGATPAGRPHFVIPRWGQRAIRMRWRTAANP